MTRTRVSSGRAAKPPVAATAGGSLPLDASVLSTVANLEGLDLNGLRRQWRAHLGSDTRRAVAVSNSGNGNLRPETLDRTRRQ